jgi:hypothetical protein
MNAYTRSQARILPRDIAALYRADQYMIGASLAALERHREWQAEAEVDWLLKQYGVTPQPRASRVSMLRQTIGAAMIRAGARLRGVPEGGVSPETAQVVRRLGTVARPARTVGAPSCQ